MALGVLEYGGRLDITQELDSFKDDFFKNIPEAEMELHLNGAMSLYFAIGNVGLYYLDDWTSEVSRTFEKVVAKYNLYSVSKDDFQKIMHKYIYFIHERRPFKNELPL